MTKIIPISNKILVKQVENKKTTPGGIIIPTTANQTERNMEGEVLAVGPGRMVDSGQVLPMTVKPGNKILFDRGHAVETKVDGETYLIMTEDAVVALFE